MAGLSFIVCLYFQWWSIAIVAFVIAVIIPQNPVRAFLCGFFALFILWVVQSFWLSYNNGQVLAYKLSLLIFKTGRPMLMIILTGLTGGIVAGFASLAGSFTRKKSRVNF
jgi:hypothetical protein